MKKGITLIALIITVIVLLILAGTAVSISFSSGDLFSKAKSSTESWNEKVLEEEKSMIDVNYYYGEYSDRDIYYMIDGTTLYLNNSKKDENYKKVENDYFLSLNFKKGWKFPEWAGTAQKNESGNISLTASTLKKVVVENVIRPERTAAWFFNCRSLTEIDNIENIDTTYVTDMSYMFYYCISLTDLDLSTFNTGNVTTMERNVYILYKSCKCRR